jgi:sensor c-di-GMP phosphodiesterase-like protein
VKKKLITLAEINLANREYWADPVHQQQAKDIAVHNAFVDEIERIKVSHKEASQNRAKKAATASHARHADNKAKVVAWYADHRDMTKDAAAEQIIAEGIVHATFRTVRDYLKGQ